MGTHCCLKTGQVRDSMPTSEITKPIQKPDSVNGFTSFRQTNTTNHTCAFTTTDLSESRKPISMDRINKSA